MKMKKIQDRLDSLSIDEIVLIIKTTMNDTREGSIIVFSAALDALELKIPNDAFVRFCDEL